jgi:hypothetical protein
MSDSKARENPIIRKTHDYIEGLKRQMLAEFDEAEKYFGVKGGGVKALLPDTGPEDDDAAEQLRQNIEAAARAAEEGGS